MAACPQLLVAGAFDRYNFGDLLFPRVLRRALRRLAVEAPLSFYSTTAADLRVAGGVSTRPLDSLAEEGDHSRKVLLVAGGEVLDAGWAGTYAALSSPLRAFAVKALDRTLGAETLSRFLLGSRRQHPWVPSTAEAGGAAVAYWSVGGSGLTQLSENRRRGIRRNLSQAVDLSVRDPRTLEILQGWGLRARLAPDSAVLASELFPRRELLAGLSPPARELLGRLGEGGYFCLQLGRYPSRGHLRTVADQLSRLHTRELPILLLPLGLAPAHEDHRPLRAVQRLLRTGSGASADGKLARAPVLMGQTPSRQPLEITDLLALIGSARVFAGTSLHGNLTALTYGVPRVGLGPGVRKLDLFLRTWDPTQPQGCAPFSELADRAAKAIQVPEADLTRARERVLAAGWDNLHLLLDGIS